MDGEIRSGFEVHKILDYVQYVNDNFDTLNDGKKHYLNNQEIYVCRIGEYLKLGKPGVPKSTGFAFVKKGGRHAQIQIDNEIAYRFINGTLFKRIFERNGKEFNSYDKEFELTKEFVFHSSFEDKQAYILCYEELVRIQKMSKVLNFEIYLQSFIKK